MSALSRFIHATSSTLPRQCASAGFLFAAGDIIAQQAVEKRGKQHDVLRTLRLTTYGGLIFSPIVSLWFTRVLERVPFKKPPMSVISKVALDQSIAAPGMVALFLSSTTLMAGGSTNDAKRKLDESWWSTLVASWKVWIPVQAINMAFVPPQQRLLFVNVVNLGWNTFLSLVSGSKPTEESSTLEAAGAELVEVKAHKLH